ncbi:MAG TPA: TetR/AcrR family transcriptional regulator [Phenylobacterium sp.]|nr:TetR/AcrR family transcriptional regulator [Phenylobacterium sp.]
MRYSDTHKEETRRRIVVAAARAMRAHGPDGVGVARLMGEVGLTHGGFYAHFPSKDDLIGAVVTQAFDDNRARLQRTLGGADDATYLSSFVDGYVSAGHRDHPERGCPIATLSTDLPRQGEPARAAFDAGVKSLIKALASRLTVGAPDERDALAGSLVAEMAGAVALARAVSDPELSDRLLNESRRRVKARMGLPDSSPEKA